jgi:hypothetical protein
MSFLTTTCLRIFLDLLRVMYPETERLERVHERLLTLSGNCALDRERISKPHGDHASIRLYAV